MKRETVGERLERYEADSFQILSPELARWLLVTALVVCFLFDRFGVFVL